MANTIKQCFIMQFYANLCLQNHFNMHEANLIYLIWVFYRTQRERFSVLEWLHFTVSKLNNHSAIYKNFQYNIFFFLINKIKKNLGRVEVREPSLYKSRSKFPLSSDLKEQKQIGLSLWEAVCSYYICWSQVKGAVNSLLHWPTPTQLKGPSLLRLFAM